jgi:Sulfotransferase family
MVSGIQPALLPDGASLFFGLGAGRCGTMALANLLNSENGVTCLHEGKMRTREIAGEKLLPFLTLQNGQAYQKPETAKALLARFRGNMPEVAAQRGDRLLGDIAYNYAPFLEHIPELFPEARIIVMVRNGVDFVQTATALSGEDFTPVGWPPRSKPLSDVENYVGLGRWRPRPGERWAAEWETEFDHFERNAWLWAETNRAILRAIPAISQDRLMLLRFEDFFGDLPSQYPALRAFLGISGEVPEQTANLLAARPINHRSERAMAAVAEWSPAMKERFLSIAGDVMAELGYSIA